MSILSHLPQGDSTTKELLQAHTSDQTNPHRVTAEQVEARPNTWMPTAKQVGALPFDVVITTQAEFEALIASPTWLGAVSVCFMGDGGTLKFTRSDGKGCKIPQTVKQIQGVNSATIEVSNFIYNGMTSKATLWYGTLPTTDDYGIDGLIVNCICTGNINGNGFHSCTQLTNCTGTGGGSGSGFTSCTQLTNCTGTGGGSGFSGCTQLTNCMGTGGGSGSNSISYGFSSCTQLTNCTGIGTANSTSGIGFGYGFTNCTQLTNCTGTGTATGTSGVLARGFSSCTQLTNCTGTGTATNGVSYSFYDCKYLNACKQGGASTTAFLGGTNTKVDTETVVAS